MKNKLALVCALLVSSQVAMADVPNVPTAVAVAATQGASTQINQPTTFYSVHGVNIANDSPGMQTFYWTISLCPETQPEHCIKYSDHIGLAQGQHWSHTYNLKMIVVFHAIGTKPITAKTEISGAASAIASDTKYADVHYLIKD